ncbi:hypothetical protein BDW60DRAFT_199886 [Aspergillus nidulans var. acristatus]
MATMRLSECCWAKRLMSTSRTETKTQRFICRRSTTTKRLSECCWIRARISMPRTEIKIQLYT